MKVYELQNELAKADPQSPELHELVRQLKDQGIKLDESKIYVA